MRKSASAITLLLILFIALALRLTGLDWDDYLHYHPDERYITWVATSIEWPQQWATAFVPHESSLNPYYWPAKAESQGIVLLQDEPRKFAYGHLPLYLGVAATRLAERLGPLLGPRLPAGWLLTRDLLNQAGAVEFTHLTAVTRAFTGLVDVATVAVLFFLGRRLYGTAVGLLASAFLALNVMHIQLAHFFTFDPYLTFFVVLAVYLMSVARQQTDGRHRAWFGLLAAVAGGLAVGSKFAAVLLLLPLLLLFLFDRERSWAVRMRQFTVALGAGFFAFALTNPFALLDQSCQAITPAVQFGPIDVPPLDWHACFLENVGTQGGMVRGDNDFPFVRQYSGTIPYLYFIEMQLRWGMGPLLGLLAFAGLGWATIRGAIGLIQRLRHGRRRDGLASEPPPQFTVQPAELLVLAWTLPFFLSTGNFYVKFMRYLQPLVPFLMLYAAAMLLSLPWRKGRWTAAGLAVASGLTLATTALYALAFVNLYASPHPWTAASRWIYDNIAPGQMILNEKWDDDLPVGLVVDGTRRSRNQYEADSLTWLSGTGRFDDEAKLGDNLTRLAEADYLSVASNRIYGVVPRLPERYPLSSQVYPLLFDGSLGYELVYVGNRSPNLAGVHLQPDTFSWPDLLPPAAVVDYLSRQAGVNWGRADESFTVYDQPLVMIFENSERLSVEEMQAHFTVWVTPP